MKVEHNEEEIPIMGDLPEYIDGLPNISGAEQQCAEAMRANQGKIIYLHESGIDFAAIRSACAVASHMHQPLIPAGGAYLPLAEVISNLKTDEDGQPDLGDNHNARFPVVLQADGPSSFRS